MLTDQEVIEDTVVALSKGCGSFRSIKYGLLICRRQLGHLGPCRMRVDGKDIYCYEWWLVETAPAGTEKRVYRIYQDGTVETMETE